MVISLCPGGQETHYFADSGTCTASKYASLFSGEANFDATPQQLTDPREPALLRRLMPAPLHPRARFIAVLREPIDRLVSWYNHKKAKSPCDFCHFCSGASFKADAECIMRNYNRGSMDAWYANQNNHGAPPNDINRAMLYHAALTRWRAAWPRSQLMVVNFGHLVSDSHNYLVRLRDFTGIARLGVLPFPHGNNKGSLVKKVDCPTWTRLHALHASANAQLYSMLDQDFEAHLGPPTEPLRAAPRVQSITHAPSLCPMHPQNRGRLSLAEGCKSSTPACVEQVVLPIHLHHGGWL
jgi:hypothetical protein